MKNRQKFYPEVAGRYFKALELVLAVQPGG